MDKTTISNIVNGVKTAFMDALKTAGLVKDENTQMCETLTNALDTALAPMNEGINAAITDAVTAQMVEVENKFNAAITAALKDFKPEAETPVDLQPITDRLDEIEKKIGEGAGSANPENTNVPVTAENHKGIKFE